MEDADQLLQRIQQNGHTLDVAGPQPESAIVELERALSVTLPPSYRAFLRKYGHILIYDSSVVGICHADPLSEHDGNMYGATLRYRQDYQMPEYYLVIQYDEDAPYCFDTRYVDALGEMPVVCYELYNRSDGSRIARDFTDWFINWFLTGYAERED